MAPDCRYMEAGKHGTLANEYYITDLGNNTSQIENLVILER